MEPQLLLTLLGLVVGVAVTTVIGAGILSAAIWLYNFIAEKLPYGAEVSQLDFARAALVVLITSVVNFAVGYSIDVATGPVMNVKEMELLDNGIGLAAQFGSILFSLLIMSVAISATLPTTFLRAVLISLCYLAVVIAIVIGGVAVVMGAWLAFEAFD